MPRDEAAMAADAAAALLSEAIVSVKRQRGGANNRLYRVRTMRGQSFALKEYPRRAGDARDRLGVEFGALEFLGRCGVTQVPRALKADRVGGFALYEWIDGGVAERPSAADIDAALALLGDLHDQRLAPGSSDLPLASEACLSASEILAQVERRLQSLAGAAPDSPELAGFLTDAFQPVRRAVEGWSRAGYQARGWDFAAPVAPDRRSLSPSDFGFHNAIRRPDGRLVFVDMEYFGWDDPAKLVADFCQHPGMTLSADLIDRFYRGAVGIYGRTDDTFGVRLGLVYPLFGLRWCMILLNEFLPERWQARLRAGAQPDHRAATNAQLAKARGRLAAVRRYWMEQRG